MEEIFRDVKGYEGYYQVSNLGNVISLERTIVKKDGSSFLYKGKNLPGIQHRGYLKAHLRKNSKETIVYIHRIVWDAFGDGTEIKFPEKIIDHIDQNKLNNRIDNLRIVDVRENSLNKINNNVYAGTHKRGFSYSSTIKFKSKKYHLGTFKTPEEANERYLEACNNLDNFEEWYNNIIIKK